MIIRILILSCLLGIVLISCESTGSKTSGSEPCYQSVDPSTFDSLLTVHKGSRILDVRTKDEFSENHLASAVNWDLTNGDFEKNMGSLKDGEVIFVYCQVGGRSKQASKMLQKEGVCNIIELNGGILAWMVEGKEVE